MKREFHLFEVNGDKLMALPTGEVFIIDDLGADVALCNAKDAHQATKMLEGRYPCEDIIQAWEQFDKATSNPPRDHRNDKPPRQLRALCLNVTHRCNLSCSYCFADNITGEDRKTMTSEVMRGAFDFLFANSHGVRRLQVDFFGGEPMMAFDRVKEGVAYARSLEKDSGKKVLLTLTTNATLLNREHVEFFRDNEISLILSLDGPRATNDTCRKYPDGTGSYDKIIKNIRMVKSMMDPQQFYVRGTFTALTPDVMDTLEFFDREGFYNVSLEPVSAPDDAPYALTEKHLPEMIKNYHQAAQWMLDKGILFYHFNLETDNPLCLTRRITGCGAGVEYMAVDPVGDLYACHQFIENPDFYLGNIFEGIKNKEISRQFRESTLYKKKECPECWARFYCGGGCHFQHFVREGSIDQPSRSYCDLFRGRMEAALWFNVRRNLPFPKEILKCRNSFA